MEKDTTSVDHMETVGTQREDASAPVTMVTQFVQVTLAGDALVSYNV